MNDPYSPNKDDQQQGGSHHNPIDDSYRRQHDTVQPDHPEQEYQLHQDFLSLTLLLINQPQFFRPQQQHFLHQQLQIQNYNQQMQLQFELQRQQHQHQHQQQHQEQQQQQQQHHQQIPMQFQVQPTQHFSQISYPQQFLGTHQDSYPAQPQPQVSISPENKKKPISRIRTPDNAASSSTVNISELQLPGSARKRHRRSDSTNIDDSDFELKQLAFKASEIPLTELALKIKAVENDDNIPESRPSSIVSSSISGAVTGTVSGTAHNPVTNTSKERQRQIFAMVWLLGSCESSATAVVPRNRIYARYVQLCADNSLKPLSPASFGKLVRILFPNLTTRRLGMRGQSKYHYCGIKLVGDNSFHEFNNSQSPASVSSSYGVDSPQSQGANTPSFFGSPITIGSTHSNFSTPATTSGLLPATSTEPYFNIHSQQYQYFQYQQGFLKYIPNILTIIDKSMNTDNLNKSPIVLPSIYPHLPRDSDYDIADTLYSLYRVHCTTVFESLRYMHIKKLFAAFSNFTGILTAPVSKLYASEFVFEWVKECDNVMYKTMTKMLTKLHLQNVPSDVLANLKIVASQYTDKLSASIQNKFPKSFIVMKITGAQKFVKSLTRLIRVIETGQSTARILNNSVERQAMLDDWMKLDINEIVLREVPCSKENVQVLLKIFNTELIQLFDHKTKDGQKNSFLPTIASFLADLPSKFSRVNARMFLLVASNLLTTCLREISLSGGQGFGAWWVVRCWVDEYLNWYFELGGILMEDFRNNFEKDISQPLKTEKQEHDLLEHNLHAEQSHSHPQVDDAELENRKIFDLLDDSKGFEDVAADSSADELLDLDHVGVEKLLGKSDDLLGLH